MFINNFYNGKTTLFLGIFAFCFFTYFVSVDTAKALPVGCEKPGYNQMKLYIGDDYAGASRDLNRTFCTPELSEFETRGKTCSNGRPCISNIPGFAHRSWPRGSCAAVCNLRNKVCTFAIVMDRGPNEDLRRRTIDANIALKTRLKFSGLTPASYKLVSLNGPCPTGGVVSDAGIMANVQPDFSNYGSNIHNSSRNNSGGSSFGGLSGWSSGGSSGSNAINGVTNDGNYNSGNTSSPLQYVDQNDYQRELLETKSSLDNELKKIDPKLAENQEKTNEIDDKKNVDSLPATVKGAEPTLICLPSVLEDGENARIFFACNDGSTTSKGVGFDTGGQLSGVAASAFQNGEKSATYTFECSAGTTKSCEVVYASSSIGIVADKSVPRGSSIPISWRSNDAKSCVLTSPQFPSFKRVGIYGETQTPELYSNVEFKVECETISGLARERKVFVEVY